MITNCVSTVPFRNQFQQQQYNQQDDISQDIMEISAGSPVGFLSEL